MRLLQGYLTILVCYKKRLFNQENRQLRSEVPCILIIISHLIVCSSLCHQVSQQYTWAMHSRDKTPMTKCQHRKLQYKKCYPQPQNPKEKKISGISYIGSLSVVF